MTKCMTSKKKIAVLTGAGISQESGISTFRDSNGLWENYSIEEVATPEAFEQNPSLVLDFYNKRREQMRKTQPNSAHHFLKTLEKKYRVTIITQNIDDLHEKAASSHIIHLHGELSKARSIKDENTLYPVESDILLGDKAPDGAQLRPHVVWFGELVLKMEEAIEVVKKADIFIIIGTSLQVYPAASLIAYTRPNTPVYIIDPSPNISEKKNLYVIPKKATEGCKELSKIL